MTETIKNEAVENEAAQVKPYTFRDITAADLFPVVAIIHKIGIKELKRLTEGDNLKNILGTFSGKRDENSLEAIGISIALEIADIVFGNLGKCEADVFKLLASLTGLDEKTVRAFSPAVFAEMVIELIGKQEFKDFIKVVSKSFK